MIHIHIHVTTNARKPLRPTRMRVDNTGLFRAKMAQEKGQVWRRRKKSGANEGIHMGRR